jgi:hypothetical protein
VARRLAEFVAAGAVVVGPKPVGTPSEADDQAEFRRLVDGLWGKGIVEGQTLVQAAARVTPDFTYTKPDADSELLFVHRKLADGDVYWVNNRLDRAQRVEATFRVAGKAAEIWRAETGAVEQASYSTADGRTTVPLELTANDAVFVVFRKPAATAARTLKAPVETVLGAVEGAWQVAFQAGRGAPEKVTLPALAGWEKNADAGVKYFSGTAVYTKTVEAPAEWFGKGGGLWLDLGAVKNLAEVTVNGKAVGTVWRAPFRVEVSGALKPGANTLRVRVANLWVNRLIGDQQPGARRYTYTTRQFYKADSPLLESGLLGPVRVVRRKVVQNAR